MHLKSSRVQRSGMLPLTMSFFANQHENSIVEKVDCKELGCWLVSHVLDNCMARHCVCTTRRTSSDLRFETGFRSVSGLRRTPLSLSDICTFSCCTSISLLEPSPPYLCHELTQTQWWHHITDWGAKVPSVSIDEPLSKHNWKFAWFVYASEK